MVHDDTPSDSRQSASRSAELSIDWDVWRRELRSGCTVLRRQIELLAQGLTPEAATESDESCTPTSDPGGRSEEVPPAREDRLALLKRQLNSQIEISAAGLPRTSG